jgi:hypothetical protein
MLETTPSNGNSKSVEEGTEPIEPQVDEAIEKKLNSVFGLKPNKQ